MFFYKGIQHQKTDQKCWHPKETEETDSNLLLNTFQDPLYNNQEQFISTFTSNRIYLAENIIIIQQFC